MSRQQRSILSFFGKKDNDASSRPTKRAKKTNKENETSSTRTIPFENVGKGWKESLGKEFNKDYFMKLDTFLKSEYKSKTVFPPKKDVFSAFRMDLDKVRVVVIGQDPYHGTGQANGLAFSVRRGIKVPPSLRNIFKEVHSDVGKRVPGHGDLTSWASQGVFLLNTVLTVRKGAAFSHRKQGWENFTDATIRVLNREREGLVFLCWGRAALKKAEFVDRTRHCVLDSSHPSPLGATKTNKPFIGSKCFSKANAYLKKQGLDIIDWGIPA